MRKQVLIIVSVALTSFLMGTMLSTNFLASGAKPPSIWDAIDALQTRVNELNATVIGQQAQITELQTQVDILNATKLGTPDYDSGWCPPSVNDTLDIDHNLGTISIYVLVLMKRGDYWAPQEGNWIIMSPNRIHVTVWTYGYRIMLWKIAEP